MRFDNQWLQLDDSSFERKINLWFTDMSKPALMGGYKESTRKEHIQQAVNLVADYARYREGNFSDPGSTGYTRNMKFRAISRLHMTVFKTQLPQPSPKISDIIKMRNLLAEKQVMLEKKIEMLNFWGDTFKSEGFLQGDPVDVQYSLMTLYADAKKEVEKGPENWGYRTFTGIRVEKTGKIVNDGMKRAISGEATIEAGVKAEGEIEVEWKSVRGSAKFEAFGGFRGGIGGSAEVSKEGFNASAQANAELGFKFKANAQLETDLVVLGGEVEAFAGAMAEGSASIKVDTGGLAINASASAFAGVKAKARGFLTIKFKGFEISTIEGTGEISAGIGAEASFSFEASIYGKTSFSCSANTTMGVGMGGNVGFECNMNNLRLAGTAFLYEDVRQWYMQKHNQYSAELIVNDKSNRQIYDQTVIGVNALLQKVKQDQMSLSSKWDMFMSSK